MTVKLDIPDPFEEQETPSVELDIPDPFDETVSAPEPKKGMSTLEGAKEGYKFTGRLGMGMAEGITRGAQGLLEFGTAVLKSEAPAPENLVPKGLPTRKGYKRVLGAEVPVTPEDIQREKEDAAWRAANPGFNNPTEKFVIEKLRKGSLGLKQTADALRYMRTGTDVEQPELPPGDTALTPSEKLKETTTGKIMQVAEEFSPLAGQMVTSAALGGGPALALQTFGSHLAEGRAEYKRNNPNATEAEATKAAVPGAMTIGLSFQLMGPATRISRSLIGKVMPGVFGKTVEGMTKYGATDVVKDLTAALISDVPYLTAQGIAVGEIDKAMGVRDFNVKDAFTWESQLQNALIVLMFKGIGIPAERRNAKYMKAVQDHINDPTIPIEERGYLAAQIGVSLAQRGEKKLSEQFIKTTKAKFDAELRGQNVEALQAEIDKVKAAAPKPIVTQEEVDTALEETIAKSKPVELEEKEIGVKPVEAAREEVKPVEPKTINLTGMGEAISGNLRTMLLDSVDKTGKLPSMERNSEIGKAYEAKIKEGKPRTKETLQEVLAELEAKQVTAPSEERIPIIRKPDGEVVRGEVGMTHQELAEAVGLKEVPEADKGFTTPEGRDVFAEAKIEARPVEPKVLQPESNKNIGVVEENGEVKVLGKDSRGNITEIFSGELKDGKIINPDYKEGNKSTTDGWLKETGYEVERPTKFVGKAKVKPEAKPEAKPEEPGRWTVVKENVAKKKSYEEAVKWAEKHEGRMRTVALEEAERLKKENHWVKGETKFYLGDKEPPRILSEKEIKDLDIMVPAVRTKEGRVVSGKVSTNLLDNDIHPALAKKLADEAFTKGGEKGLADRVEEMRAEPPAWGYKLPDGKFLTRKEAFTRMEKNEPSVFKAYFEDQKKFLYRPYNKDSQFYKWTDEQIREHMREKGLESITYLIAKGVTNGTAELSVADKQAYFEAVARGEQPKLRLENLTGIEPKEAPKTIQQEIRKGKLESLQNELVKSLEEDLGTKLPKDTLVYYPEPPTQEARAVSEMARDILGKDIIYCANKYKGMPILGAAIRTGDPNTIFINIKDKNPVLELLGHEWGHELDVLYPGMLEQFIKEVTPYMVKDIEGYTKLRRAYYLKGGDIAVMAEFWPDALGRAMGKETFWRKLQADRPGLFGKVVTSLIRFVSKIKNGLAGKRIAQIETFFTDFEPVVDAAVKVFNEYAVRKQIEKIQPIYDTRGNFVAYEMPGKKTFLSVDDTIKVLKEEKGKFSESFKDAVKMFVYPPMGVSASSKQRFGEYKGEPALVQAAFKERVRKIQNKIRKESLESWIDYNDKLRTGQEIPEAWKEYNAIGEVMGPAAFDNIVSVYPEMESMRREYHNAITLQWAFEGEENAPFLGLGKGLRGDSSFRKKYSGKTPSELIESGMVLKSTDPISTMARSLEAMYKFAASGKMLKNGIASNEYKFYADRSKIRPPADLDALPPEIGDVHKNILFPPAGYDVRDASGKKVDFFEEKANAEAKAKEIGGTINPGGGAEFIKSFAVLDGEGNVVAQFPQRAMAKSFLEGQDIEGAKIETWLGRKTTEAVGRWYAPKDEVRLLKNYLSADKIRQNAYGDALIRTVNAIKAFELFSLFHFSTITQEIGATRLGLAFQQALSLNGKELAKNLKSLDSSIFLGTLAKQWLRDPEGFRNNPTVQTHLRRYIGEDATKFGEIIADLFDAGILTQQDPSLKYGERKGIVGKIVGVDTARKGWDLLEQGVKTKDGKYVILGGLKIPKDVVKGLQNLLFEHYIPSAKVSIAMLHFLNDLRQYKGQLERGTMTRYQLAKEAVTFAEMRMGEVNWENLGFNKTYKTILQGIFRAPLWKGGTIAAFLTAVKRIPRQIRHIREAIKYKERVPIDKDIAWIPGIIASHMMGAMMIGYGAAWVTGKEELKPDKLFDYFFPKIGIAYELITGDKKYRRGAEPGYLTEAIKIGHSMKEDPFLLPLHYLEGGLNSYFGKVGEIYRNRDFFGNQIYDEDDGFMKRQMDKALFAFPLPFGVVTAKQAAQLEEGPAKWVLATGLIQKAPAWVTQTEAGAKMTQYLSGHVSGGGFTKEEAEENKMRRKIVQEIRNGAQSFEDFKPEVQDALTKMAPDRAKRIIKSAAKPPVVSGFGKLKMREAESVWKLMNQEEKLATAETMVKHIITRYKHFQNDEEKLAIEEKRLTPILDEIQKLVPEDMMTENQPPAESKSEE